MGALDLVRTGAAGGTARGAAPARETLETLLAALLARGVLALPAGIDGNVLELLPPLTITEEQLERGLSEIDAALEEVGG
jgi:4-aminobutyrate aminotransferase-like enzyme